MEDTLRDADANVKSGSSWVLILVLMEDTLRDETNLVYFNEECLNPCFNGRYSQRIDNYIIKLG